MLISNKKIAPNVYQFLPKLLTKQLAGKAHKAKYKREECFNISRSQRQPFKRYEVTEGNVLYFDEERNKQWFIYADHLWRVCRLLDHSKSATLTITDKGIEITQPKQRVFLKWLTRYAPLDITLVRWH